MKRPSLRSSDFPYPPPDLLQRTGEVDFNDPVQAYESIGRAIRMYIESVLPSEWTWENRRVLDFGCGAGRVLRHFLPETTSSEFWGCDIDRPSIEWLKANLSPPLRGITCDETPFLDIPNGFFDFIYSISVFTHLTGHSAGWLVELHRVMAPGSHVLISFLGEAMLPEILNEPWIDENIGFNTVLHGNPWSRGGPLVFQSPWWIQAHWGRAFDILHLSGATAYEAGTGKPQGHGLVLMRKKDVAITAQDIERFEPNEPRELTALRHNVGQLARELIALRGG